MGSTESKEGKTKIIATAVTVGIFLCGVTWYMRSKVHQSQKASEFVIQHFHANHRKNKSPKSIFILVHGLNGCSESSWLNTSSNRNLYDILHVSYPHSMIITYGYPNAMSKGWSNKKPMNIQKRAENFLFGLYNNIKMHLKFKTKIIFIGHSMGGLIIKQALVILAGDRTKPFIRTIYKRTIAVVFYATPHKGSNLANVYLSWVPSSLPIGGPTQAVEDLKMDINGSDDDVHKHILDKLNIDFGNIISYNWLISDYNIRILSLVETQDYLVLGQVVSDMSSRCGFSFERCIPLDYNHINICKPENGSDARFAHLETFVNEVLANNSYKELKIVFISVLMCVVMFGVFKVGKEVYKMEVISVDNLKKMLQNG